MNLFKTTLIGAMVAGIACVNVSANDSQDFAQEPNIEVSNASPLSTEEMQSILEIERRKPSKARRI